MVYDSENSDISDCRHIQHKMSDSPPESESVPTTDTNTTPKTTPITNMGGDYLCNQKALQRYVLHCCQDVEHGGLKDKPGKGRDFYHRYGGMGVYGMGVVNMGNEVNRVYILMMV